jgi:hypothetical protein
VPLGEAAERYAIDIPNAANTATLRTLSSTSPVTTYTAAEQTADFGAPQAAARAHPADQRYRRPRRGQEGHPVTTTPRLALPYILTQQAQKEVTHAAGLNRLDALVQPVVQQVGLNTPPASPAEGACWIIGTTPTGAWAGQVNRLVQRIGDAWVFHAPFTGLVVFDAATLAQMGLERQRLGARRAAAAAGERDLRPAEPRPPAKASPPPWPSPAPRSVTSSGGASRSICRASG